MRLFSYVLRHDGGFAPNPFHGLCTLACCKPVIRRTANPGDWVLGLTPKALAYRLAYAMQVLESLPFSAYWDDARFLAKRPGKPGCPRLERVGDNCYLPDGQGGFRQIHSVHSLKDGSEDPDTMAWDLSGQRVLVAERFCYFGKEAVVVPPDLDFLVAGRGHRSSFTEDQIGQVLPFLTKLPTGVHGAPREWPEDDGSWRSQPLLKTRRCR